MKNFPFEDSNSFGNTTVNICIIIGNQRVGATAIGSLIEQQEDVNVVDEIFFESSRYENSFFSWLDRQGNCLSTVFPIKPTEGLDARFMSLYDRYLDSFIEEQRIAALEERRTMCCFVFHIKYDQLLRCPFLAEALIRRGASFIHIQRRDLFAMALSQQKVRSGEIPAHTVEYFKGEYELTEENYEEIEQIIDEHLRMVVQIEANLRSAKVLNLDYETMFPEGKDYDITALHSIFDFLSLPYRGRSFQVKTRRTLGTKAEKRQAVKGYALAENRVMKKYGKIYKYKKEKKIIVSPVDAQISCPLCLNGFLERFYIFRDRRMLPRNIFCCSRCGGLVPDWTIDTNAVSLRQRQSAYNLIYGTPTDFQLQESSDSMEFCFRELFLAMLGGIPVSFRTAVDVGCSDGRILDALRRLGFSVKGMDIAPSLVDTARRYFGFSEDQCFVADALAYFDQEPSEIIDLVVLWHVLQSFPSPSDFLHKISRHLGKKSIIIAQLSMADPNHVSNMINWYPSEKFLRLIGKMAGLEIIYIDIDASLRFFTVAFCPIVDFLSESSFKNPSSIEHWTAESVISAVGTDGTSG